MAFLAPFRWLYKRASSDDPSTVVQNGLALGVGVPLAIAAGPILGGVALTVGTGLLAWDALMLTGKGIKKAGNAVGDSLECRRQEAATAEAERRRIASIPRELTTDELAAEASNRYLARLRTITAAQLDPIERQAAIELAKRRYLAELDGLIR